ncbi:MAG TPA: DUF2341 domain-containing protein [Candidatus Syntrophoarchaeum butanivorans]|uniref:DUF2341 domain-containing protein n=1 Tax=Candidatus Syntropharchaeum butanivorans TaxID=1839936 RepID=A0A7C0X4X7_9EURY|nr:DUF2341 domain-containing protein [Candidatus Syntrophoarchaeum butanivorans]
MESRRKSKSGSRSIKRIRTALVLFIIVGFFISSIHPTFAASYSYTWDEDTKTATIYIDTLFGKKPVLQIRQVSVKADLMTFTEVLEIMPLVNYTLTSSDLKYLWKRYKGRHDISSFRLQRLVNEPYTIQEPVYEAYNVSMPVYDATNTTVIAYQNETRKRIVGYHDVVKYRKTFKDFNPAGKSIEKGKTYTIKVVLHKKPELGDVRIHLSPQICGLKINELTWWNSSWKYRLKTTVSDIPPGGYQLNLTVHSGSGTNNATDVFLNGHNATNFDDIRFVLDDTTELAYWIEDNTTDPIKVWVNVTDNGTVYLYYGNPTAASASDGDATFLFFDDFDGSDIDTTKWNVTGTATVSGGEVTIGSSDIIETWRTFDEDIEIVWNHKTDAPNSEGGGAITLKDSSYNNRGGERFSAVPDIRIYDTDGAEQFAGSTWSSNTYKYFKTQYLGATFRAFEGDEADSLTLRVNVGTTATLSSYPSVFQIGDGTSLGAGYNLTCGYVRIRKYTDPEPAWSTWSSEAFSPVEDVRPLLDYNSQRKLARTSEGYLHRVYTKWDGSSYRVYYGKSTDDGSTWTESVLTDAGVNSTHPAIAVDSEDNIWVVYEREGGGIRYRVYQGTSWGSEQILSTDAGEAPALAVDASDNVHVIWMANLSGTYKVRYSYYNGTAWNDTINITASTEDQKYPSIAIDPYSIHVVWQEYDTANNTWDIKYRRYQSGWDSVFNITNESFYDQIYPSIAVDLNNNVHVVWEDENAHQIKYRRYDYSTSSWGSIETVCDGGEYPQLKPSISVYSTSNVYVVWYGKTSSSPDHWVIRGAYRTTSWSSVSDLVSVTGVNVTSPSTIFARYPQICVDCYTNIPDSDVAFVYEQDGEIEYNGATWRCTDKYVVTIIAKDANTGQVVSNFTVEFSTGETKTTDNGAVKFRCLESGYYQATVTATGYYPSQSSIVLDQSKELIVYLTPITETTYVLPKSHLVEFIIEDFTGSPIEGVNVTAVAVETTMEEGWLSSIFGFENETEIENTTMNGTTDSEGRISFLMVETLKYRLTFTKPTAGINKTLYMYPKEEQYVIILPPGETPDITDYITWNLSVVEINSSYSSLNLTYTDSLNKTSSLRFFVLDENQTEIYNQTFSYQTTINASYIVEKQAGKSYFWGFNATHDEFGEIQATKVMRFRGRLIDLGIENESYYSWIAISLLIFVSLLFSGITAKFGYFTVPGMAMFFWWIGWLSVRLSIVLTALIMGVLLYIGKREREEGI